MAISSRPRKSEGRPGAIVLGASLTALGVVRSLGRAGIPICVLSTDEHRVAAFSRYTQRSAPLPREPEAAVGFLLDVADRWNVAGWTIFPTGDEDAALVARHHARLGKRYALTTPPWEILRWAYDKRLTYRLAAQLGIDHPRTFCPADSAELSTLACAFPVVLKPAAKPDVNALTVQKAWRVDDRETLLRQFDEAERLLGPGMVLVQEHIPGAGQEQLSFTGLCREGQVVASVTARRARQYPLTYGRSSTFVETVYDAGVVEPSRRFLQAIGYTGIVEVEFKRDARDGRCKLLDVNARTWTWQTLCPRAGVDFHRLAWGLVHGEPLPQLQARTGVRWVRLLMDLAAARSARAAGQLSIAGYLRSLRPPIELAIFAGDDLVPSLVNGVLFATVRFKRMWARSRFRSRAERFRTALARR